MRSAGSRADGVGRAPSIPRYPDLWISQAAERSIDGAYQVMNHSTLYFVDKTHTEGQLIAFHLNQKCINLYFVGFYTYAIKQIPYANNCIRNHFVMHSQCGKGCGYKFITYLYCPHTTLLKHSQRVPAHHFVDKSSKACMANSRDHSSPTQIYPYRQAPAT